MIPGQAVKVVFATKPVDFRKGHNGLAAVVQKELGLDPHSSVAVVFRSKRGDWIKVLYWDGSGIVLTYKRLEDGKFAPLSEVWRCQIACRATGPAIKDRMMRLSRAQFEAMFEGLDWRRVHARRVRRPTAAE